MTFTDMLNLLHERGGSDLYLSTAAAPMLRVNGEMTPIGQPLARGESEQLIREIMEPHHVQEFAEKPELNFAVSLPGVSRFRVNVFKQRGEVGVVARSIKTDIPDLASLGLPPTLKQLVMAKR